MMPQEWPISETADQRDKSARAAGSGRLRTVSIDFFLEPAERLTEQERALMTAMLRNLVDDIAAEIRAALPAVWSANEDEAALVNALARSGLLNDSELIALLLRRADEERIATASRGRTGRGDARAVQGLVSHPNGEVSAAAMGVVLARGRRRDRFGQCLVAFDDLSSDVAERLVYAVAAALRRDLARMKSEGVADRELVRAAGELIERHDRGRSLDVLTQALVAALERAEALSEELLFASAREGEVAFLGEVIGRRAGISGRVAFEELLCANAERLTTSLRLAGFSRQLVAALLASVGDLLGIDDAGAAIEAFDSVTAEELEAATGWLAAPNAYRASLNALGDSNG